VTRSFAARVRAAVAAEGSRKGVDRVRSLGRWLRPVGGLAIAASVATVAILGLQRTQQLDPAAATPVVASSSAPATAIGGPAIDEQVSYTVPAPSTGAPVMPAGRLTSYVVAHSEYSSPLGRRNVLSGIIAEDPTPMDELETVPAEENDKKLP
jgi:sigma-E factor negative regulatory protein RseA